MYDLRIDNLGFNYIVNELKKESFKEKEKNDKKQNIKELFEIDDENPVNNKKKIKDVDDDFFKVPSKQTNSKENDNNFNDKDFEFGDFGNNNKNNESNTNKTSFEDIFG